MRKANTECNACLTGLTAQMRQMAGERDRTQLNGRMLSLLGEVLFCRSGGVHRRVRHQGREMLVTCAEIDGGELRLHDAYLITPGRALPLGDYPLLERCVAAAATITETGPAGHRCVVPVLRHEEVQLLIEIERERPFVAEDMVLLEIMVGFFADHLALIEYAEVDTLTGLLNRKTFDEHLDRVLASASDDSGAAGADHPQRRHARPEDAYNWLAVIDVDHFKKVNDSHGHLIGDEVLLLMSQLMQQSFRMDDQLFRFGGEEFVAVLQPTGATEAREVLERFRRRIEAQDLPIVGQVTASIGFTRIDYFDNPIDLVDRADKALYYAKDHGRNRVEGYEELHHAGLVGSGPVRKKSDVELF